ncbi:GNAT family N-acetyltransferase [Weissella paramesenteroides]|nr:GNAT family N-acetyltransferase [Weissella paramesenteroides]KAA8454478.1 GNAT family N-acetyltransferase [Weissella paramesenteroides]
MIQLYETKSRGGIRSNNPSNIKGVFMKLIQYSEPYAQQIANYVLKNDYYSRHPQTAIKLAKKSKDSFPVLSFSNDTLVSFFTLDTGTEKANYTKQENTILLKSFSTDSRYTGKGFASKTLNALPDFMKKTFPKIKSVILGVNQNNLPAINLYKKCGFQDTGRKYLGEKGYQLIFVLPLR